MLYSWVRNWPSYSYQRWLARTPRKTLCQAHRLLHTPWHWACSKCTKYHNPMIQNTKIPLANDMQRSRSELTVACFTVSVHHHHFPAVPALPGKVTILGHPTWARLWLQTEETANTEITNITKLLEELSGSNSMCGGKGMVGVLIKILHQETKVEIMFSGSE